MTMGGFLTTALGLVVPQTGAAQALGDSLAVLGRARDAQASFERVRFDHLPWAWPRSRSGEGEIVGRFRVTDDDDDWRPPPEPEAVIGARAEILASLAAAAASLPGDGWVVGQRVRYLVEAGRSAEALGAARACRAEAWWCRALAGYAFHAAGDFGAAGDEFDSALIEMPPAEREGWLDLDLLLEGEAARAYRDLGPGPRAAFARRLWWLADPLWSLPGNDLRTEHFARRVASRVQRDARSPFGVRWGEDLAEITIRFGWPTGWERMRASAGRLAGASSGVIGHDPPGERRFVPEFEAILAPFAAPPEAWPLEEDGARATYAPAYAERFLDLGHQLAVFRRGDSAVVVAGWSLPRDSVPVGVAVETALVVAPDPDAAPVTARSGTVETSGSLVLSVPWMSAVVSVEVLARDAGVAGRSRHGLPLPGRAGDRPAVSDILLLKSSAPLPAALPAAIPLARGSARALSGESLGLYWEVYPPAGGPIEARFAIKLRDEQGGFWRGLKAALGLGRGGGDSAALEWYEPIPAGVEVYPRAVLLALPDLPAGAYTIELEVRMDGEEAVRALRPIVVTD